MINFIEEIQIVEWIDSYGCSSEWTDPEKVSCSPHHCFSIGFILKESQDAIVIVPHFSPENKEIGTNRNICGEMTIPKKSIIDRKILVREGD